MIRRALYAAALLLALASPAWAGRTDDQGRQDMIAWGTCAYETGIFMETLKVEPGTVDDQDLARQALDSLTKVGSYYGKLGRTVNQADADEVHPLIVGPIDARVERYAGKPDMAAALRDEFRADLRACIAKADALTTPAPAPSGT